MAADTPKAGAGSDRYGDRLRHAAAEGLRAMWYGAQAGLLRRRTGGFSRPGESEYRPRSPPGGLSHGPGRAPFPEASRAEGPG